MSAALITCAVVVGWVVGAPPEPPRMSTVVPAGELVEQVRLFVKDFETWLATPEQYAANADKLRKEAHTVVMLAQVLALHDDAHELKASAPALLRAALPLARAKDYEAARKALPAVSAALSGSAPAGEGVKWEKIASLGQVMEQISTLNTKLRTNMRRFEQKAAENARYAAVLAAVGQAIVFDTHEVKQPEKMDQWYAMSIEMRDAASELAGKLRATDKAGATAALGRMQKSCDACHEVFHQ